MYKIFIICYLFVFIAFFRHYFFSGFFLCFSLFIKNPMLYYITCIYRSICLLKALSFLWHIVYCVSHAVKIYFFTISVH